MLTLRRAIPEDTKRLFRWRTDPVTVANSLADHVPTWDEHTAWLRAVLADRSRHLFLVEHDSEPIGMLRLDRRADDTAEVSITVAPEHRGKGYAARMLDVLTFQARELGITRLTALVGTGNRHSLSAFHRAGYEGDSTWLNLVRGV